MKTESTKEITVSALWVNQLLAGAYHAGIDIPALLVQYGINPKLLQNSQARLPIQKVKLLGFHISTLMNDETIGMLEKPFRIGHFRFLAMYCVHQKTIGDALKRVVEYYNLAENSFHFSLVNHHNETELILTRIKSHKIINPYAVDLFLSPLHRFIGWLANTRIILNQVTLDFSTPEHFLEYNHMYCGAPILFDQDSISIRFDSSFLKYTVIQTEKSVKNYLHRMPLDLFLQLDAGGKFTLKVRQTIYNEFELTGMPPSLDNVAKILKLEPQTLRRRLKKEKSCFHSIKSQIRRDIAIHYLGDINNSIAQISIKTGYTEPGAFIRAFKSWTGFTPLQFRRGLRNN